MKWSEMKWSESHSVMSNSLWPDGLYGPWNSPGQNTGMGSLSLLQEIFRTQGSNPGLPHCSWILYQLSHKRSPILEWVAYSFSRGFSQPRNRTGVSCITDGFFTNWAFSALRWLKMGRKFQKEGVYVYIWLVYLAVQQKIKQHCETTIFQ